METTLRWKWSVRAAFWNGAKEAKSGVSPRQAAGAVPRLCFSDVVGDRLVERADGCQVPSREVADALEGFYDAAPRGRGDIIVLLIACGSTPSSTAQLPRHLAGCVVTAVVNLSGAFWPQLIPSAILGPAVTAIRTAGFFELFRGNGCTWAPWRPLRCDHTKLQEPHRNQLFLHFIYHPVGLPIHLLSF